MTFFAALRWYIVLLFISVLSFILVMPKEFRVNLGPSRWCQLLGRNEECLQRLPIAKTIEFSVTRPSLQFSFFGKTFQRDLEFDYGLDISGGTEVVLQADLNLIAPDERKATQERIRDVILKRIQAYGLKEYAVLLARSGQEYRLHVRMADVTEPDSVKALIGTTANLEFREYKPATPSATASTSAQVQDFVASNLKGSDLEASVVMTDPQTSLSMVGLEFKPEGATKLAQITKRNIGKPLAIFLDEYPISTPKVENEIIDGRAMIRGQFTSDQAKSLSAVLNSGPLPASVQVISLQTVQPTLGSQTIPNLIKAGIVGILAVSVFMLFLYQTKGLIATISLFFFALVTLAIYKLLPITLTVPGIAGFLLSLGMSMDTSILVFERLKEEEFLKRHSSQHALLAKSFKRAWDSVKDANSITLGICFLLANPFDWQFLLTFPLMRGFAVTLAIGILVNMLIGMKLLKVLLTLFYRSKAI